MDVHLSGDLERLVLKKVEGGLYRSADEVISEACRPSTNATRIWIPARWRSRRTLRNASKTPATQMDFSRLKRRIHEEIEACHLTQS
ncbi:MAG: hypothetical protein ABJC13_11850 [Acidobacteriota bacterium]